MKIEKKLHKLILKKNRKTYFNHKLLNYNNFAIQSLEKCYLTFKQIESVRKIFVRLTHRELKIWIKVNFKFGKTSKPKESRMGKGKGKITEYVAHVTPGKIVLEVLAHPLLPYRELKKASLKLPFKSRVINSKN